MEPQHPEQARSALLFWVLLVLVGVTIWVATNRIWPPS
jgi:hypothetical protein